MTQRGVYLCPTCGAELPEGVRWRNGMLVGREGPKNTGNRFTTADVVGNARLAVSALDGGQREMLRFALGSDGSRKSRGFVAYEGKEEGA